MNVIGAKPSIDGRLSIMIENYIEVEVVLLEYQCGSLETIFTRRLHVLEHLLILFALQLFLHVCVFY